MQTFISWLQNPLDTESGKPDVLHLFLLVGLLLVLLGIWAMLFRHIREAV